MILITGIIYGILYTNMKNGSNFVGQNKYSLNVNLLKW